MLIVGDAPDRESDLERFWQFGAKHDVCCINRAGLKHPDKFKYWYSGHPPELLEWAQERPDTGAELWSYRDWPGLNLGLIRITRGSSSLNAVQLALTTWGYSRVVLAGVPLSGPYELFRLGWTMIPEHAANMRSMSGWTAETFGEPDAAFVGMQ